MSAQTISLPQAKKQALGFLGYCLLTLVVAQVFLLGTTGEITTGKVAYAALFGGILLIWGVPALLRPEWRETPLFRWTLLVFALFAFSRFVGAEHHIRGADWLRELTAFVGYSWLFFVPLLFRGLEFPLKFYKALLWVLAGFSVANAFEFMQLRGFSGGDSDYAVALNGILSAPIFGFFMSSGLAMSKPKGERAGLVAVSTGFFLAALLSGTRTSIISITTGLLLYSLLLRRYRKSADLGSRLTALWSPLVFSVILFALAAVSGIINREAVAERIEQALQGTEAMTVVNRLNEARDALDAIREHPIVGQGLGYKLGTVFLVGAELEPQDDYFIHNFLLYVLVKFGLIGVFVFGGFIWVMLRSALTGFKTAQDALIRGICGSTAALIVALLVQSITLNVFSNRASAGILMLITGMVSLSYSRLRETTLGAVA